MNRSQKSEVRGQKIISNLGFRYLISKSKIANCFAAYCLLFTVFFMVYPVTSHAVLRGLPEGKSKVEVGDNAPLETADLKKAHEEGKVILLMFGNPDHCIYCEKVWASIEALLPRYEKDAAGLLKRHRASKFWGPASEDVELGERYGVIGEPWLFIIDKQGIVRNVIMGPVGRDVIEAEINKLLKNGK